MRVLVTGHDGYIGVVLVPRLRQAGHEVTGLDSRLFEGCTFGPEDQPPPFVRRDIRDVTVADLRGFDAVLHLAAISNDPLGDLNPDCTYEINHRAAVQLARKSKSAGAGRFVFSSSCSLYGAAGDDPLDESAAFNPVTPYGHSKVLAEGGISALADDNFTPTFLRNATAYGVSSRLRGDLVVNNLVGYAVTTGEVFIKSDGSPWRPLVHVDDIATAFLAALEAPRQAVHNQAFNVGRTAESYRVREVAEIVESVVPQSKVTFAAGGGPDKRNYRVNCDKIAHLLPGYRPRWTVADGVAELYAAFVKFGLKLADLTGSRYQRIRRIQELQAAGRVDDDLRVTASPVGSAAER
ncbi:MAG: NAD-dependent epimerase/dehydratase family protein [Anaerolineales bacterium]